MRQPVLAPHCAVVLFRQPASLREWVRQERPPNDALRSLGCRHAFSGQRKETLLSENTALYPIHQDRVRPRAGHPCCPEMQQATEKYALDICQQSTTRQPSSALKAHNAFPTGRTQII